MYINANKMYIKVVIVICLYTFITYGYLLSLKGLKKSYSNCFIGDFYWNLGSIFVFFLTINMKYRFNG